MFKSRILTLTTAALAVAVAATPAVAAKCVKAGGAGIGITPEISKFMSEAALKNSAKAWGGDKVKIGKVAQSCKYELVVFACTASARACK